jgi:hypothetical protein
MSSILTTVDLSGRPGAVHASAADGIWFQRGEPVSYAVFSHEGAFLVHLTRDHPRASRIVLGVFVSGCFVSLCLGVINQEVEWMLGGPFTYQWLYYSDFVGHTARTSVLEYVTLMSSAAFMPGTAAFVLTVSFAWRRIDAWALV